ncbi:hypothetical protein ACKWTF_008974 [Chironomus riparius]
MKISKKVFVNIFIVLSYVIIFGIIAKLTKDDLECFEHNSACFRFCSDNLDYSDEYLLTEFNKSKSSNGLKFDNLKVYRGIPTLCGEMEFLRPNDNITSENKPYSLYRGSIYIKNELYDFRRYCLEKSDYAVDGWKLMICTQSDQIHRIIHFITISISVFLITLTLFVYIYFNELRNFHGKCAIPLVGNQILTYVLSTAVDLYSFNYDDDDDEILYPILKLSLIHTLLWITVMLVHSLLTFLNYKNRTKAPIEFSTYAVYVIACMIISAIVLLPPFFRHKYRTLYTICFIISCLDVIFVIITGFNVFVLSRHQEHSTQAIFKYERKWFWTSVQLALIFVLTWMIKFYFQYFKYKFLFFISIDFLMLLSAITVTILFLGRNKVKILIFAKFNDAKNKKFNI